MFEHRIEFVGSSYANLDSLYEVSGIEAFHEIAFTPDLSIRTSMTKTYQEGLLDIPQDQYSAVATWKHGKILARASWYYMGDQRIGVFNLNTFETDVIGQSGRNVVDLYLSYKALKDVTFFMKADNLLDENYTEAAFRTPGATFIGGVEVKF